MAEKKLSPWGSYCCFLNASFAQGFLYVPVIFQHADCIWLCLLLFLVAQGMTFVTAKQLIRLAESLQTDSSAVQAPLLTPSPNTAIEVDLPTMMKGFFQDRGCRNFLYIAALFISLTYCIQVLGSFAHFFAMHFHVFEDQKYAYVVGMGVYVVVICILNSFDLRDSEVFHSLGAVARVGLVVLLCVSWNTLYTSGINFEANRPKDESQLVILPLALLICFMQVMVPGLTAASPSSKTTNVSLLLASVTFFVMCASVGCVCASYKANSSEKPLVTSGITADSLLYLYLVLIAVVIATCSHIFSRTLTSMIVGWRYGTNLQWAKELYPKRIKAIYYIAPVFIAIFPLIDSFLEGYLGIYNMPLVDLRGVLILLFGYICIPFAYAKAEQQKGGPWTVAWWGLAIIFAAVAVYSYIYSYTVIKQALAKTTITVPACVLGIMAVWAFVGKRVE